jgi:L-ascorbate metabolism protein UlaG (beta-lactamase superfamily)
VTRKNGRIEEGTQGVIIRWLGHSCFYITSPNNTGILTDPCGEEVGYPPPGEPADIVTVSHNHHDHNAVHLVPGNPRVIREPGLYRVDGAVIEGIPSFHDDVRGKKRGKNVIFIITMDGLRVCHLGDLGEIPDKEAIARLGEIDVLLIPVGGTYTITAAQAYQVSKDIAPRIVIPMHYKTPALSFSLETSEAFTKYYDRVKSKSELEVTPDRLPAETEVVVLNYL